MRRFERIRLRSSVLGVLVLVLASVTSWGPAAAQTPPPPAGARFAPDEVLVQYKQGVSQSEKADARASVNATPKKQVKSRAKGDIEVVKIPPGQTVAAAVNALSSHPTVEFAEPNWILEHQTTSNDPSFTNGSMWGMYGDTSTPSNQYGSQAAEAWSSDYTGSSSVYVCIVDEGVDHTHGDLADNIWSGRGWDFYHDDSSTFDSSDGDDHGTHVAGTIGAVGGNGKGVAGVAWQVKLVTAKFLGPNGGYTSDAVAAIDYCTGLKTNQGLKVVATNNSWGGGGYSQALHGAIIRAAKAGILFVAAAGNSGSNNDSTPHYPSSYDTKVGTSSETAASYDAVIAVAALTSSGGKASFSSYGANSVDLGAPGSGIYSTLPSNRYGSYSGTSMATPHVTGAIALYAAKNSGASAESIRNALLNSTVATSSMNNITTTDGRLNVSAMLGVTPPPPPPPDFSLSTSPTSRTITQGQGTNYTVTVTSLNGYNAPVTLSLESPPSGVSASFSPSTVTPPSNGTANATLTITTTSSVTTGSKTLTIKGQDSGGKNGTATVTLVVNAPVSTVMHVGDLDGSSARNGSSRWEARVTIKVQDANGTVVSGASVTGSWSQGASGSSSCTTSTSGTCTLRKTKISNNTAGVTFSVTKVSKSGWTYQSSSNADPDSDSDGTTITISKP